MANEMNEAVAGGEAEAPVAGAMVPVAKSLDEMTDDELVDAAFEMAKRFPWPDLDDCKPDAQWFVNNWNDLLRLYPDEFVAIHGGAVVAHGPNAHRVRLEAARKLNISPQRFIVEPVCPITL